MERGSNWRVCFLFLNIFVQWPYVFAQEGYLSLACGRSSSFTDSTTGINWIPDDKYTSTGIARTNLSSPHTVQSFRYFPTGRKNCYTLELQRGKRYLIRGTYIYYGSDESPPEFDVAIDATTVLSVKTRVHEPQVSEVIFTAQKHYLDYCLLTRAGFPVISSLELRLLPESFYPEASSNFLTLVSRIDSGNSLRDVRYPDDSLDRIWRKECGVVDSVTTADIGTVGSRDNNGIPDFVLASARRVDNITRRFEYTTFTPNSLDPFVVFLYATELDSSTKAYDRISNVSVNGMPIFEYDVLESQSMFAQYMVRFGVAGMRGLTIAVEAAKNSREPPAVNAIEIYQAIRTVNGTKYSDVQSLMSIKKRFKLLEWSGDPCLPIAWEGVTCDVEAGIAFVTRLDLSDRSLTGTILDEISSLSHLKQLQVDCPELHSKIPSKLVNRRTHNFRFTYVNGFLGRRLMLGSSSKSSNGESSLVKTFVGILVGITAFLVLIAMAITVYCYRKHRSELHPPSPTWTSDQSSGPNYTMKYPVQDRRDVEMKCNLPQKLSLKEVQSVTGKFKTKIGEGGFGAVYVGTLSGGSAVAVKVRSMNSNQGTREFTTELDLLQTIHHENLVPLVGFCTEYEQQILIYPYMSNGSLHDRLYDRGAGKKVLDWQTRLNIVLGAARGINFLHTGGERCIIHRDVKSSNILLDDSMKAKIADFGLSKYSPIDGDSLISTEVRGTAEYLDPEYYSTRQLTEKSDVYSFGIVLLEIVCGRQPLDMERPRHERSLLAWVRPYIKAGNIHQIVDAAINQSYCPESLWRVLEIALQSVEPYATCRPTIAYIVRELEDALIIENNASQYMASAQSLDSLCVSTMDMKEFSAKRQPLTSPLTFPFEPSSVFSDTMTLAPDPR